MPAEIYKQSFLVDGGDIDELGHVNNVVYLRWAQDIATAHWRARAGAQNVAAYVWVVARHEIDYRAPLTLGDGVEAQTWVDAAPRGAVWRRFVDIYRAGDEKPAVQVQSNWCLLDAATRRLKRVPPEMAAQFFV
jgi:acyl-CoA thioester hydrolase